MPTGRHGIIAQCKRQSRLLTLNDGRQVHRACCCGIITAERLLYQSYGQGDTRARPAFAPMVDYTMPLRGYGIITAARSLYRLMPNGSPLTRQPPSDGQLYHAASRTWYNNFMRCARAAAIGKNSGAWSRPCVCGPSRPTRFDSGLCRQKRRRAVLLCVCIEKCREGAELVAW